MKQLRIYRAKDSWVLCTCNKCGRLNYVEPHCTTAHCIRCNGETEHTSIPHEHRDMSGCYLQWAIVAHCPKCGKGMTREQSELYTDEGTGAEEGRQFAYCSEHCRETH